MDYISNLFFSLFTVNDFFSLMFYVFIAIFIAIGFNIASMLISRYSRKIIHIFVRLKNEDLEDALVKSIARPSSKFLKFVGIVVAIQSLPFATDLNVIAFGITTKVIRISTIIFLSVVAQNLIGNTALFLKNANGNLNSKHQTIIKFFINVSKAIIIAVTGALFLYELGYDITGLIAGVGLSGVVFALAAQDTASNFFSGLIILVDRPFELGDWIAVGSMEGVVEEINFRSSRIRTFDNALIAVPNSKLSNDSVINWSKMNMRKTKIYIGLLYSTSKETLQKVCDEIQENIKSFAEVNQSSVIVRFDKFNDFSLDLLVQYNSYPIPLADHTKLKERVQYMIMDVIDANDTDFAYPTQTIYTRSE